MQYDRGSAANEIAHSISATEHLRSQHRRETTRLQRGVDRLTALAAHPFCVPALTAMIALWTGGNMAALSFGWRAPDPPPFFWLQGAICTASLYVAVLLVSTQRREAQLADHRAHLILEMAIQAEQKSAKTIQLLEEYRSDNPLVANRRDEEASAMAAPADHHSILTSIKRDDGE